VRRGVTICVMFAGETAEFMRALPFYLQDIAWVRAEQDDEEYLKFEEIFARRVESGFKSLRAEPSHYADLPVYDSIRRQSEEDQLKHLRAQFLVLCSYQISDGEWRLLRKRLENNLKARKDPRASYAVQRVLDLPSGRLSSMSAFGAIRQAELCLIDVSDWRANVLFELGVRLASNPRGALLVMDVSSVDTLAQHTGLRALLKPIPIERRTKSVEQLLKELPLYIAAQDSKQRRPFDASYIHSLVWRTANMHDATEMQEVSELLFESARPFLIETGQETASDTLYPEYHPLRKHAPFVAVERLIAAWLFLCYRHGSVPQLSAEPIQGHATKIATRLVEMTSNYSVPLDERIHDELRAFLTALPMTTVRSANAIIALTKAKASLVQDDRKRGDAAREKQNEAEALQLYTTALNRQQKDVLSYLHDVYHKATDATMQQRLGSHLADAYGIAGGLQRRLNQLAESAASYEAGRQLEEKHDLSSTYNRTNSLLLDLITHQASATALATRAKPVVENLRTLLSDTSLKGRSWSLADYGFVLLLAGGTAEPTIELAYGPLVAISDFPKAALERVVSDLRLCQAELTDAEPELAAQFGAVIEYLEAKL
jgi:hypothetical protein